MRIYATWQSLTWLRWFPIRSDNKNKIIFTLTSHNFCISTPLLKLECSSPRSGFAGFHSPKQWGFLACAAKQNTWLNYRVLSLYIPTKVGISVGWKQAFPTPTKGDTGGDEHNLREICIRVPCSSNRSSFPFLLHIHDHNCRLRLLREVWILKLSAARPWPGFTDRRLKDPVSC